MAGAAAELRDERRATAGIGAGHRHGRLAVIVARRNAEHHRAEQQQACQDLRERPTTASPGIAAPEQGDRSNTSAKAKPRPVIPAHREKPRAPPRLEEMIRGPRMLAARRVPAPA